MIFIKLDKSYQKLTEGRSKSGKRNRNSSQKVRKKLISCGNDSLHVSVNTNVPCVSFISALSDALDEETPQEIVHVEEDYNLYSDQPFGPVAARKVTEVVQSAVGILKSAIEYPKELITDAARPGYWVPDSDVVTCNCCNAAFKEKDTKHHCRACGMGVCSNCSESRRPVPSRGWDHPVRVCDQCAAKKGQL